MSKQMEVLSETLGPPVTEPFLPEAAPAPTEPAATPDKRERRTFPIRLFVGRGGPEEGWTLMPLAPFDTIAAAERWIRVSGADDACYLMARVIGASQVRPRAVVDVVLP